MGASKCFSPVRGRAMRVTKLDGCGRPVYGDSSVGVTDGFVTISFTANTDEGEEISVTKANGQICVRETPCPTFLGYSTEIEFCNVDPALFAILTGQDTVTDSFDGTDAGFRINSDVSACDSGFALEVWTGTPGVTCAPETDSGANPDASPGGYLLLPYMQGGVFGDFEITNGAISFTVTGAATKTGSGWGLGPYDVVPDSAGDPGPLATPIQSGDHLHIQYTDVAPPEPSCGTKPLLNPNGAEITSVTATPSGLSALFAPTPAGSDPWWIDFGDGTWDYSATGASITHAYATAGTYTVTAYRGSTSVTSTVTVTTTPPPAPTITSLNPATGPAAGGTTVTITGTGLTSVTSVTFDGTAGTALNVTSATSLTITTPPGTAGAVDVVVTGSAGTDTETDGFTYTA